VSWEGKLRAALQDADIQPRPDQDWLPVWLATGGKPASIVRAADYHLPIMFSDIGSDPAGFGRLANLYREASTRAASPTERTKVGIAGVGYVDHDGATARRDWKEHFYSRFHDLRGTTRPDAGLETLYTSQTRPGGSFFVGSPEEIADRIITLHGVLGHDRQLFESDWGHIPYLDSMRSIELFGTRVKPLVDQALGHATTIAEASPVGR
jgi:alkanesulfonate monooxygenase SsuD/methylene tetrahydromethanopterin reductase-like flavin-dependent oxidoreductase (luciferase family)